MFAALGTICLAITDPGRSVDWPAAQAAFSDAARDLTGCLHTAARDTLGRALAAHTKDPAAAPTFGTPPRGSACRPVIRAVAVVSDPRVGPNPVLRIVGDHLFEVTAVRIGGVTRAVRSPAQPNWKEGEECGTVTVPAPAGLSGRSVVTIHVVGAGYAVDYTWKVQPAVDANLVQVPSDGSCGLQIDSPAASPSP